MSIASVMFAAAGGPSCARYRAILSRRRVSCELVSYFFQNSAAIVGFALAQFHAHEARACSLIQVDRVRHTVSRFADPA